MLKLKAWQSFSFLFLYIILTIVVSVFNVSINDWTLTQMAGVTRIFGLFVFALWLFLVGQALNQFKKNPHKFSTPILALASLSLFSGYSIINLSLFPELESAIPLQVQMLSMPIAAFGLIFIFYNLPMSLKSIETGEKAKYSDCILDALLFFSCALGLGIWWLQPRMNRVEEKNTITNNA
jgi:hypothetical protein